MASMQVINVKGIKYYSVVECRRINGKPKPVTIAYLGNIESILAMYNDNKYKNIQSDLAYKSYSYGAVYALWAIAKKHNIIKLLNTTFPEQKRGGISRGETLLLGSIYRAIYPGSKNEFSEIIEKTSLPAIAKFEPEKVTSQHFWSQMHGINEKMIYEAEDKIAEQILCYYEINPNKLSLDYTNYFTYIDSNNTESTITKRGHNKQKRDDLRQFSLGIVTTKDLAIPLCSYVYEGNMTDVVAFPKYLELLRKRIGRYTDSTDITLIYDNGSVSKKNLKDISGGEFSFHYVCAFSLHSCKELLDIPVEDYSTVRIKGDTDVICYRTVRDVWEEEKDCILIYSRDLYEGQYIGLLNSIQKKTEQLRILKKQLRNKKSKISKKASDVNNRIKRIVSGDFGEDIFKINISGVRIINDIDISINNDILQEICRKHYGKRLLITDRSSWTTEEILESYWEQDAIEKIFKDTKNRHYFSIQPQFHWTDSKVRVHTFCCLLGLLLTSLLKKELADAGIKMENDKIIKVLSDIRETYILSSDKKAKSGFKVQKQLEQLTPAQEKVWAALNKSVFSIKGK